MIREAFRQKRDYKGILLETIRELGKQYSRLELSVLKLRKRNSELFNVCKLSVKKGLKGKAIIYANEIAEVRKTLSFMNYIQLALERVILRLETIKEVCPTLQELKGVFSDVENVLKLLTNLMPSISPEISKLNNVVSEILDTTEISLTMPTEPLLLNDSSTEMIIQEASEIVKEELKNRIPEPPILTTASYQNSRRSMIALTASGPKTYAPRDESKKFKQPIPVLEDLILDYLERNNGEINLAKCAAELNISVGEVQEILDMLNMKGKIKIEQ